MFFISQNGMHSVNLNADNLISIDVLPKSSTDYARRREADPAVPEYCIEVCVSAGYHPERIILGTYATAEWAKEVAEWMRLGVLDDRDEFYMPPRTKEENDAADQ